MASVHRTSMEAQLECLVNKLDTFSELCSCVVLVCSRTLSCCQWPYVLASGYTCVELLMKWWDKPRLLYLNWYAAIYLHPMSNGSCCFLTKEHSSSLPIWILKILPLRTRNLRLLSTSYRMCTFSRVVNTNSENSSSPNKGLWSLNIFGVNEEDFNWYCPLRTAASPARLPSQRDRRQHINIAEVSTTGEGE